MPSNGAWEFPRNSLLVVTFKLIIRHKNGFYMHVCTCMYAYVCLEYSFCESCLQKNSWYGWDIPWFPFKNFFKALLLLIFFYIIFLPPSEN